MAKKDKKGESKPSNVPKGANADKQSKPVEPVWFVCLFNYRGKESKGAQTERCRNSHCF